MPTGKHTYSYKYIYIYISQIHVVIIQSVGFLHLLNNCIFCFSLYPWCMLQDMPTGNIRVRRQENGFQLDKSPKWQGAKEWLDWMSFSTGKHYETAYNGKEHSVLTYRLDGYWEQNNQKIALEFQGCWYHGCQCQLNSAKTDKVRDLLKSRREKTADRTSVLRSLGFEVIEIYACQWNAMKRNDTKVKAYMQSKQSSLFHHKLSTSDIVKLVNSNAIFGAIECDIAVPERWERSDITPWQYFSEFCPLFRTCNVDMADIGEHMQTFMSDNNMHTRPRTTLIAGMKAEKILLATPLVKFYIEHGLIVSNIYTVIEFEPRQCFQKFVECTANDRRDADKGLIPTIQGDTSKLIANSSYGSMLLDTTKHRNMRYAFNSNSVSQQVNQPTFRHYEKLDIDFFEIEHAKRQTVFNMPIQIGFFILQYAKLRMLDFYFNCVDRFINRQDFQYCSMDTDSAYFSLSTDNFESLIQPSKMSLYNIVKNSCNNHDYVPTLNNPHIYFPRSCCTDHTKHDKRTPGLFKLEYEGDGIVALCSKMYCVKSSNSVKFSCKGISKSGIDKSKVYDMYYDVLKNKTIKSGVNTGIRLINKEMTTYQQTRAGFTYFYYKRKVLEDGISTEPLNITLK